MDWIDKLENLVKGLLAVAFVGVSAGSLVVTVGAGLLGYLGSGGVVMALVVGLPFSLLLWALWGEGKLWG